MPDLHFAFWPTRMPRTLTLPETTLYFNLEVSAARFPNKTAVVYYGRELTFSQLLDEVNRLAGYLEHGLGVRKGDRVVLYMQNCPQFIIAYYAIMRANAVVVPLNAMNVTDEMRYYVQDSQSSLIITGQELYGRIAPLLAEGTLRRALVANYGEYRGEDPGIALPEVVAAPRQLIAGPGATLWADALAANMTPGPLLVEPDDLVVLPYTSGTTGQPKGCIHTHRTVHSTLVGGAVWSRATSESVSLATLPLFHVTGMQGHMNVPIYAGSCVVLMTRWDRDTAAQLIQRYRCTGWTNISTMMVDFLANPRIGEYDLSSLQAIGGGGAPLPAAVGQRLFELTGLQYGEGYGLTETMAPTHANPPDRPKLQCLGIPYFGVDARVVDPDTLEERGPNEPGEIIVSGPQVLKSYWNRPQDTERVFVTIDGKRFFRTGDLGRYDEEGYYFFVDRIKRMINSSGYKVWPTEVEAILYRHPAVQEACVIGAPDERRGETVKAFIVLRQDHRGMTTPEEIVEWSREHMAAYKIPRIIEFVDDLPRSGTGKVQWRELQERERARAAATPSGTAGRTSP
jgi:fatty-acyl-CoA synthase